jgi:hypothetical protein
MVNRTGFYPGDPDNPFNKPKKEFGLPKDKSKDRTKFSFSSDKQGKFADWSDKELGDYLKFLDNPPSPDQLKERPEGGYNP